MSIVVEWPLPGTASWTEVPNEEFLWTIAPEELFDLENEKKIDCNQWLGQQVVMFDDRGITLKDILRMVATYEGSHSINVSRLLEVEGEETNKPSKTPERHILHNIAVLGMKYTHILVVECALYIHEMLVKSGHVKHVDEDRLKLRLSLDTTVSPDSFFVNPDWLRFTGGLILAFRASELAISHRIRAVGG